MLINILLKQKLLKLKLPKTKKLSEEKAIAIGEELGINDKFRRHKVKKDELNISYEKN